MIRNSVGVVKLASKKCFRYKKAVNDIPTGKKKNLFLNIFPAQASIGQEINLRCNKTAKAREREQSVFLRINHLICVYIRACVRV